jgi:cytoskeletal protein CcmA (bactofilin family)
MAKTNVKTKDGLRLVTFGTGTVFKGFLKFKEALCIRGKFTGTIEAVQTGVLTVDKTGQVEADHISVRDLTVHGTVKAPVHAQGKIDMTPGSEVRGDIIATRLRIAPGALFEGQCSMTMIDREVEIFARPTEEIKAELQQANE